MTRPTASLELEACIYEYARLDAEIATLDEHLKQLKDRRKTLAEVEITDLATHEAVYASGVTLPTGEEYTFEERLTCSIKNDDRDVAHAHLEKMNVGHLLKRHLILSFPKDSVESAKIVKSMIARVLPEYQVGIKVGAAPDGLVGAITEILTSAGLLPTITLTDATELPGATLRAFVKKCLVAGISLPPEFGVYAPLVPVLVPPLVITAAE